MPFLHFFLVFGLLMAPNHPQQHQVLSEKITKIAKFHSFLRKITKTRKKKSNSSLDTSKSPMLLPMVFYDPLG